MNPDVMNSMLGMLSNPETMSKMNEMMKNPQIQSMLNNPEMMQNMMNMFGIPDMRDNSDGVSEDLVSDLKEKYEKLENAEKKLEEDKSASEVLSEQKFNPEDIVILNGLKTEKYNDKRGIVHSYNQERERYIVLLDEDDIKIMVKEENLSYEVSVEDTLEEQETIIQID